MTTVIETYTELLVMEGGDLKSQERKPQDNIPRLLEQSILTQIHYPVIRDKSMVEIRELEDPAAPDDVEELPELSRHIRTAEEGATAPVTSESGAGLSKFASFKETRFKAKPQKSTGDPLDAQAPLPPSRLFKPRSRGLKKSDESPNENFWKRPLKWIESKFWGGVSGDERYVDDISPGRYNANITDANALECRPLKQIYCSTSRMPGRMKKLGEGESAKIKLVAKRERIETFHAVKQFRRDLKKETEAEYVKRVRDEFCLSVSLKHSNIVATIDLCYDSSGEWCHILDYAEGGDLMSIIKQNYMSDKEKDCCFRQLVRGVAWMHDHGIAHRDIRPENLLMAASGHLKIADFGDAEIFRDKHTGGNEMGCGCVGEKDDVIRLSHPEKRGRKSHLSPEVVEAQREYDPRALDVWSCVIVYFVMILGFPPWEEATKSDKKYYEYSISWSKWLKKNPDGILNECRGTDPNTELFKFLPAYLGARTLYRMMHPHPERRITAAEANQSLWLRKDVKLCYIDIQEEEEKTHLSEAHNHICYDKKKNS